MTDWNGSVVKPPSFEDEGALHIGKGRFLLSMSGDREGKAVSARTKVLLAILAIVVVAAALIATTLLIGHQRNSITYQAELGELFGCTLETVAAELKIPVSAWIKTEEKIYKLNTPCEICGISYELFLHFDANAMMMGFEYVADYKANAKRAASDIYKARIDSGIQDRNPIGDENVEVSVALLRKHFKQGNALEELRTERKGYGSDSVKEYLRVLEADPEWPGKLHGYVVKRAEIYEDVYVRYTPETESVLIRISRTIEQIRPPEDQYN